jgi:hypothetical protein
VLAKVFRRKKDRQEIRSLRRQFWDMMQTAEEWRKEGKYDNYVAFVEGAAKANRRILEIRKKNKRLTKQAPNINQLKTVYQKLKEKSRMKITLEGTWQDIKEQVKEILGGTAVQTNVHTGAQGVAISGTGVPVSARGAGNVPASVPVQTSPMAAQPAATPSAPMTPQQTPVAVPVNVPTSAPAYALNDLAQAAMPLADSGRLDDLQNLLATFGVKSLPELPQEQYGAFATALRNMGAAI